jgi:hypothetical protein
MKFWHNNSFERGVGYAGASPTPLMLSVTHGHLFSLGRKSQFNGGYMNRSANPEISTPEDIHRIATAFQQSRVLLTAVELGVFTALGKRRLTSGAIAEKIGADKKGNRQAPERPECSRSCFKEKEPLFKQSRC